MARCDPARASLTKEESVIVRVYPDDNGNWFASIQQFPGSGSSMQWTETFTEKHEAVDAAADRLLAEHLRQMGGE